MRSYGLTSFEDLFRILKMVKSEKMIAIKIIIETPKLGVEMASAPLPPAAGDI
jgi:hypothetical protein